MGLSRSTCGEINICIIFWYGYIQEIGDMGDRSIDGNIGQNIYFIF
jgi:hypothetical protein